MKKVNPIPEGYHTITPYIAVADAAGAIDFYKRALDAKELMRFEDPTTHKVGHAELKIGDSHVMLADEHPDMGFKGPKSVGGTPVHLHLYVEDVDSVAKSAMEAGAKVIRPVINQFYGDRSGSFEDPFGHVWHVATHVEDLTLEEVERRAKESKGEH